MYLLIDPPRNLDGAADVMTHATHYIYMYTYYRTFLSSSMPHY